MVLCDAVGNPQLFAFRTVLHDSWPASLGPRNDAYYVGANPQYTLTVDNDVCSGRKKGSMWLLFSRHLTVKEQTEANVCGDKGGEGDESDYFAVHVFRYA